MKWAQLLFHLFYLSGSHATGIREQEIFRNTKSFADIIMKINVVNIRKGRIFMPAINLFFHTLQVVFPAFQVAEPKTKICFSPERDGSNTRTVVWDLELADKVLGEVLYETKVAFSVIYD